jgi:hypothetical protein
VASFEQRAERGSVVIAPVGAPLCGCLPEEHAPAALNRSALPQQRFDIRPYVARSGDDPQELFRLLAVLTPAGHL